MLFRSPVRFLVLDNSYLGMVRQWQELFYGRRYSAVEHPCPDFAAVARSFGAAGRKITDPSEVHDAIAELLRTDGPAVLVCEVEPEENVYPFVAPGKSLNDLDLGKLA